MTTSGHWSAGDVHTPSKMNSTLIQYVTFANLPTTTSLQFMAAVATDGVGGNGGLPALYIRADGTASWTLVGTLKGVVGASATDGAKGMSSSTWTTADLDTEQWDSDTFHDTVTNNSRFTIPTGMGGKYLIGGYINFEGTGSLVAIRIRLNATTTIAQIQTPATITAEDESTVVILYDLAAADYVELEAFSNAANGWTTAKMWMHKLD